MEKILGECLKNFPEDAKDINIIGVLECSSKYKYGITSRGIPLYMFSPLQIGIQNEVPPMLVGSKISDTTKNYLVLVKFLNWDEKFPRGSLVEIIGPCGDWEAERKALMWQYNPYIHKAVKADNRIENSEKIQKSVSKQILSLKDWTTFNIDPEGCEDIDDCISFKIDESDNLKIAITISNVASILEKDTELDRKVSIITQTLYSENERRSMLPSDYEKACSLLPNEKRFGISLIFDVPKEIENKESIDIESLKGFFTETRIINHKTYSYESIKNIFKEKDENMIRVCDFMRKISHSEDTHKWIETLMIYYNTKAANLLMKFNTGIFRKHSIPSIDKISKYGRFNIFLAYEAAQYCKLKNEGSNLYHYGLDEKVYVHMTSPIRRYADLINQRLMVKILNKEYNDLEINDEIISHMNFRQKVTKKHERDLSLLKILRDKKEAIVRGGIVSIIIKEDKKKIKVYINEWKRVVSIPINIEDEKDFKEKSYETDFKEKPCKTDFSIDQELSIKYFYNPNNRRWKDKIVFQIQ